MAIKDATKLFNLRWFVIIATALAAVGSSWAIRCLLISFSEFRAQDFLSASHADSMKDLGTCISSVSEKQLVDSKWAGKQTCNDEGQADKKFAHALLVSVHGIFYAKFHKGKNTDSINTVAKSLLTAVTHANAAKAPSLRPVSTTHVYKALLEVARLPDWPKTTCEEVYPGGVYDLTYANKLMKVDPETKGYCSERADEKQSASCEERVVYDKELVRAMRGTTSECEDNSDGTYTDFPLSTADDPNFLSQQSVNRLFTHCKVQFGYQTSSMRLDAQGTFDLPFPGNPPERMTPLW